MATEIHVGDRKTRVVIVIEGGVVRSVVCDEPLPVDIELFVADKDDPQGAEHPAVSPQQAVFAPAEVEELLEPFGDTKRNVMKAKLSEALMPFLSALSEEHGKAVDALADVAFDFFGLDETDQCVPYGE